MNTFCGLGLPELIILALLSFVIIGPERSQEFALLAGKTLRTLMRSQTWREFNEVASAMRDLPGTLMKMAEIEELQDEIRQEQARIQQALSGIDTDLREDLERTSSQNQVTKPAITDPWGISQAAAGTRITPRKASEALSSLKDSEGGVDDRADSG